MAKQQSEPNPATKAGLDNEGNSTEERKGIVERKVLERHSDQEQHWKQDQIADEVAVAFAYNGQSHAVMMASPLDLNDFAIGFSLTERIIDSPDDILDVEIRNAKQGITVQLQIRPHLMERLERQRRQLSGRSGCGICGITDLAAAVPKLEPMQQTQPPSHQIISKAVQTMKANQVLQNACGGVHGAALFNSAGELLAIREDVGRHNALDKLIGAQIKTINHDDFVLMSSRASHELVAKVAIAGIGTLVTISAATTLAIEVANKINLNLIGFIRGERQVVYTGAMARG